MWPRAGLAGTPTLRRRNIIAEFPYRGALGMDIDCGRFAANLDEALAEARDAGYAARRAASATRGRLRGLGIGCFLETARGTPNEGAEIRFEPDGRVSLILGTQSNGQGHETSYPQIAAAALGLPVETFAWSKLIRRRQERRGAWRGTLDASRRHGAGQGRRRGHRKRPRDRGSPAPGRAWPMSCSPDGRFLVAGTGREIDLLSLARAANDPSSLPAGMAPGLDSYVFNLLDVFTFPNGCHIAEIEIDPETGVVTVDRYTVVDDYGRLINPMLTKGQVQGGVAQGIGQALFEHTVYDPDSGQLLSGSLMDYALPRAGDLPPFRHHSRRTTDRRQPARGQRLGPGRVHRGAADHHQRDCRRARPARHRAYRHAGHAGADLARHPLGAGLIETAVEAATVCPHFERHNCSAAGVGYSMNQPWLTTSDWPVSALVSTPAKNSTASATSSVVVNSPSTVSFSMTLLITSSSLMPSSLACSGICLSTSGVRTKPGQTTLARTLYSAPSLATTLAQARAGRASR